MDFSLTPQQDDIRKLCYEFGQTVVAPRAEEMDRTAQFPYDIAEQMADLGLLGVPFPKEYGGMGGDTICYAIAVEEISRADASTGITVAAHTSLGASPFYLFGTEEQKREYLVPLARGKRLWSFGLTETEAGSDAGGVQTTAELRDGQWIINGGKRYITNSGTNISGGVTAAVVTGRREDGRPEISSIILPRDTPGYTVLPPYRKMGWRSASVHPLSFDNCAVPEENLLGARGQGYKQCLITLDGGRISVAALSVGLAQGAYDAAFAYARGRRQFGQPISTFQAIQHKLADMATEIELARTLTYKAAWLKDQGKDFRLAAAQAKLFASEVSVRAADQALQVSGGAGFMDDTPFARYYRDAKINEIGEGTSEILRGVIAKLLGC